VRSRPPTELRGGTSIQRRDIEGRNLSLLPARCGRCRRAWPAAAEVTADAWQRTCKHGRPDGSPSLEAFDHPRAHGKSRQTPFPARPGLTTTTERSGDGLTPGWSRAAPPPGPGDQGGAGGPPPPPAISLIRRCRGVSADSEQGQLQVNGAVGRQGRSTREHGQRPWFGRDRERASSSPLMSAGRPIECPPWPKPAQPGCQGGIGRFRAHASDESAAGKLKTPGRRRRRPVGARSRARPDHWCREQAAG